MSDLFKTGVRPLVDDWLLKKAEEKRDYGSYWSASTAGYCMRRNIFERLKVPYTKEDARKQRVFAVGDVFHKFMQDITKEAGISIAQELELQDEDLMIRGHIDDLVLVKLPLYTIAEVPVRTEDHLILYDYKSVSSRSFSYAKGRGISHYHKMQLGTYMYMLRNLKPGDKVSYEDGHLFMDKLGEFTSDGKNWVTKLTEARILKISKDDLRMEEQQLLWSPALEKEVVGYWRTLNGYWKSKTIPKCTCGDYEGGFLAKETYNPFYFEDEPCSLAWYKQFKEKTSVV